jgi:hypothetical protein
VFDIEANILAGEQLFQPGRLVGPIVLFANITSDQISSALGSSPGRKESAAPPGGCR